MSSPGRESKALVSATDVFATVAELCGVDLLATLPEGLIVDSVSFVPHLKDPEHDPLRTTVYTEIFSGNRPDRNNTVAIRDARYKLIRRILRFGKPRDQFFDLEKDPFEQENLIRSKMSAEQKQRHAALGAEIDRLIASAGKK